MGTAHLTLYLPFYMKAQPEDSARTEAEVVLLDRRLFVLDELLIQRVNYPVR